ncbi:MAG: [Fe-Fe] hydrogenase large subunit C-terminal domain-containing protein [Clostridiaceae bacterium]|nr:[Fe-Fe] hydrogenase large subunit C-terminal domain-containing protein [Clostridiaceae bacterium]
MRTDIITTDEKLCRGCNKCVFACPVHANSAQYINEQNKIFIDPDRCIQCGACNKICDHGARGYVDDTDLFFSRLKSGDKISVLVAPAARTNFPDYKRLLGFLRKSGVRLIYDVSFGADITTWAYLKVIQENKIATIIAQPCPVIVSYIQKHKTNLIPYLAPIQSPAMCAAIYLRKYKAVSDDLAFLSPCISKKIEFTDPNTFGYVKYNVTMTKLKKYLQDNRINLMNYPLDEFDDKPCDLGFTFSRPGGLRENVEYYTDGTAWIKQTEGIQEAVDYLKTYEKRVRAKQRTPLLVDILNCSNGCNIGTGTDREAQIDDIDYKTNQQKTRFMKEKSAAQDSAPFAAFNQMLALKDFRRNYTDCSKQVQNASPQEIENVFLQLGKTTPESRKINCFSCGYGGCREFANAIAIGNNDLRNCINYSRQKLRSGKEEFDTIFQSLEARVAQIDSNLEMIKESSSNLNNISLQTKIISFNASIESARAGEAGKVFSVVASEIKDLADQSERIVVANATSQNQIMSDIRDLEAVIQNIKQKIDGVLQ